MTDGEVSEEREHGIFARHPSHVDLSGAVAPAQTSEFNTLRRPLVVVACALLPDSHFEFDSSFVKPDVAKGLEKLEVLREANPGSRASLFGHADPVGDDSYNKTLSGRRVLAIYGLLIHDPDVWEDLYNHPFGRDKWGLKSLQGILVALGHETGRIDGVMDDKAKGALKEFQRSQGLSATGDADSRTRKALFTSYMDHLYEGQFTALDKKEDFLGRAADSGGKGDYQGCGEFNPVLMFSREENAGFEKDSDKSERDKQNGPNRRVVIYLFEPGSTIEVSKWPCPKAKEGVDGCKKRFFSDASKRRSFQDQRRDYAITSDTFACRFYDLLARESPCEAGAVAKIFLHISALLRSNSGCVPIANRPYKLFLTNGKVIEGSTGADGLIEHEQILPGDYKLEVDKHSTFVPAIPLSVSRSEVQMEDFFLFTEDTSDSSSGSGAGSQGGNNTDTSA